MKLKVISDQKNLKQIDPHLHLICRYVLTTLQRNLRISCALNAHLEWHPFSSNAYECASFQYDFNKKFRKLMTYDFD
jgi:hypothetical protein